MEIATHVVIKPKPEYVFTVDGEDFPWYISEAGQWVTRLADDLYGIKVEIFCLDRETVKYSPFGSSGDPRGGGQRFTIGGREFPWVISEEGFTYAASRKTIPTVTLTFFARHVDIDEIFVDDRRMVWDIDGAFWVGPKVEAS